MTIAAGAFAGLAVTASAAGTETATLSIMKSWYADNKNKTTDVSTEKIHAGVGPSSNSSNYPGMAAVQFTFENKDNLTINKAVLSYSVTVSGSNRTLGVYSAGNPNYNFSDVPLFSTNEDAKDGIYTQTDFGTVWTYSNVIGELTSISSLTGLSGTTEQSIEVTDYVSSNVATFVFSNANAGADITNATLTIEYADATAVEKDITINYVYGDDGIAIPNSSLPSTVKTSDTAYSGTEYVASYPATFDAVEDGVTYRYTFVGTTGEDDTIVVSTTDEDNVITLKYTRTEVSSWNIVVNAVDSENSILKEIMNTTVLDGASLSYSYPKYITDDNGKVTYVCDETTYSKTVTPESSLTYTVGYSGYTGTAYYVEGETLTGGTHDSLSNISELSNGIGGRIGSTEYTVFTALETGVYDITAVSYSRNTNSKGAEMSIYKNSTDSTSLVTTAVDYSYRYAVDVKATGVAMAEGETIILVGTGNSASNTCLDYVLIEKSEPTSVTANATRGKEFTDNAADNGDASVWTATITNNTAFNLNTVSAKATPVEGDAQESESETFETEIAPGSSVYLAVVVNKAFNDLESVTVTLK